ncbi:MAG: hypothetical protein LUQ30_05770 [Methanothrix sp.]|nr:hypothetical protein [Methanothrix sp.]
MKILLVTGRLAQEQVRAFAGEAEVLVADTDVAAFITPQMLMQAAPQGYDLILIPGAATADFSEVETAFGSAVRLGPKHAADLGEVLHLLKKGDLKLSRTTPACQLLLGEMRDKARQDIESMEAQAGASLKIGQIKIGGGSRMKVLAEVVDATRLTPEKLAARILRYQKEGADMIDLGLPLDARPEEVRAAIGVAKEAADLPVSIDSLRPDLLLAGLEAGADSSGSGSQGHCRPGSRSAHAGPGMLPAEIHKVLAPPSQYPPLLWRWQCHRAAGCRHFRRQRPTGRHRGGGGCSHTLHPGVQRQGGRERSGAGNGLDDDAAG